MVAVSDTGEGMDVVTQQRIFEPFFTTKPVGQGTGLGLATVHGIVTQSGGHIWVYSEPGRGTSFKVYLPRTTEVEDQPQQETRGPAPRGTESVLLVEDEELVREFARTVLARQGYRVHAVQSPREAIEFALQNRNSIDLILSDVVLPDISGPAMVQELKHLYRRGDRPPRRADAGRVVPAETFHERETRAHHPGCSRRCSGQRALSGHLDSMRTTRSVSISSTGTFRESLNIISMSRS